MSKGVGRGFGQHAFKVLCPEPLVSAIMGSKGATKDAIQDETGCKLIVSNKAEYFPKSRLRILVIFSDDPFGIVQALDRVCDKLLECGEEELAGPQRGPEPEFLGKELGEYVLRCAIPPKASGAIIGPRGANIQSIRDECHAKVFIDNNTLAGHQMVRVIATSDNLRAAVGRVSDYVQEEMKADPTFQEWAQVRSFDGAGLDWGAPAPHGGAPRERRRSRSPRRAGGGGGGDGTEGGGQQPPSLVGATDPMLQTLADTAAVMPAGTLEMEHTITCDLPRNKVSALIGKRGEHVKAVRRDTNADVHFAESDTDMQTLTIKGPLIGAYRAHALMMRKYHEDEIEKSAPPPQQEEPQPQQSGSDVNIAELQEKLNELQQQLAAVSRGAATGGKGKGKGKGKKGRV